MGNTYDATWNPVTGCSKVSAGCKNCYAERVFPRTAWDQCKCGHMHSHEPTPNGRLTIFNCIEPGCDCAGFQQREFTDVWTHPDRLVQPLHWKKPRRVFVNSMSDLFHEAVPFEFIDKVFAVMALTPHHTYQILTKRPERTLTGDGESCLPLPNVWLGVSVEDQKTADQRIPLLLQTPAAVRFVSYEPAIGAVDFKPWLYTDSAGNPMDHEHRVWGVKLDWVIVGGESGHNARPFNIQWARDVIRQCQAAGVAVFVKQLGAKPFLHVERNINEERRTASGGKLKLSIQQLEIDTTIRLKDSAGGDMTEWPEDLRVREFPQ